MAAVLDTMPPLERLIERLQVAFHNQRLLESALTHRSYAYEHPDLAVGLMDTERLEFLGDAILNYVSADIVFARFPSQSEGQLTLLRSSLVKTSTLAVLARELGLGAYLRLSKGEDSHGARDREALLADALESVLAAVYLDQGLDVTRALIERLLARPLAHVMEHGLPVDYKSSLQTYVQGERNITPRYRMLSEEGQEHNREYVMQVMAGDEPLGIGRGRSKQAAEQAAARMALEQLQLAQNQT